MDKYLLDLSLYLSGAIAVAMLIIISFELLFN
jgi:hypothetical protein